jgi:hypothetical protein
MKTFQDLKIKTLVSPEKAIEEITKFLPDAWKRNKDREADLAKHLANINYCFEFQSASIGHAMLFLSPMEGMMKVPNIVPMDKIELTIDEYNRILDVFINDGIKGHFEFEVTKSDVELSDLIGEESVEKFYAFSRCANKSTGRAHPSDEARWFDFVMSTVRNDDFISLEELRFFLIEDGWDEQSAFDLSLDYSYGFNAMQYALARGIE